MVKVFLWKAANELLPTKKNLFQRKVVEDPFCPVCFNEEESVTHVLWECPAANDVWANGLSTVSKWKREEGDFLGLWEKLMGGLDKSKLEEIAVQLRKVWLRRNILVFEKRLTCPKMLISTSIETLKTFKQANSLVKSNVEPQQSAVSVNKTRWVRPEANFVKVNWDASLDIKERKMGTGVIFRDEKGEALLAACDSRRNVVSPDIAECHALWKAMQLCNDLNIQNVIFEGDAKAVIMAVKGDEEIFSYFGSLIDDIRHVLNFRKSWSLQFDYREKNTVAHNLAKAALHIDEEKVWIESVPDFIVNSLDFDRRCMQNFHI